MRRTVRSFCRLGVERKRVYISGTGDVETLRSSTSPFCSGAATTFVVAASQYPEMHMRRFKKVMLVTSVISGVGLTAAGVAQADCDGEPAHAPVANAQSLECDQEFTSASLITVEAPITVLGDSVTNIGNFCTLVGPSD
jgi:hypothetical protein